MREHRIVRLIIVPVLALALAIAFLTMLSLSNSNNLTVWAAPQQRPLEHDVIDADTSWGPGVITVTSDVVVRNGSTLTVLPDTKVVIGTEAVPTDTTPYAGGASDQVEIIVEDGRLVADGFYTTTQLVTPTQSITFTSGTFGDPPWGGIRILGGDTVSESVISYVTIEQASGGIHIENCSPTVTHNVIHNIYGVVDDYGADGAHGAGGEDGTEGSPTGENGTVGGDGASGEDGGMAYGIMITGTDSTPWVAFNTIHHVVGGIGGAGGAGGNGGGGGNGFQPMAPLHRSGGPGGLGADGGAGGDGGTGGDAAGITVINASPTLRDNLVHDVSAGPGGRGGNGGHGGGGGTGQDGSCPQAGDTFDGGDGGSGGSGGPGGMAGESGRAWGIQVLGDSAPLVRGNEIYALYALYVSPAGGQAGSGGSGGDGGNGCCFETLPGEGCAPGDGGIGGHGGHGGDGGQGSAGGPSAGIQATGGAQPQVMDNLVWWIEGGSGGDGGQPGTGGAGGNAGIGSPVLGNKGAPGGDGGHGGRGGDGGNGAAGIGLHDPAANANFNASFIGNTVFSIHGGHGGNGGSHTSGTGGLGGGGNTTYGQLGGDGGAGGRGTSNGTGGDGGQGVGIRAEGNPDVINNVVYGIYGGDGGDGRRWSHHAPGDGGDGGNGGQALDGLTGGTGGDGGAGGDAASGGNAAEGLGIVAEGSSAAPRIVNNTVDRLDRGDPGVASTPGGGGAGGTGGSPDGADGQPGATGSSGSDGAESKTVGLYFAAGAMPDVYNNVIVRTAYTATEYYVGTFTNSVGISGTAIAGLDHNDVWGWQTNYAGVTAGTNDISQDPLFVDVLCMDCEDYRLGTGSPCIDAANDAQAPKDDHDNVLRPQDGDGDGSASADIGAHEVITGNTFIIPCDASGTFTTLDDRLTFGWSSGMCVTCTITMTYTPLAYPVASVGALVFGERAFAVDAVDCHGNPVTDLAPPLALTVNYDDPLPGVDEETLKVYRWDPLAWAWQGLTISERDTASNTITVELDHLSDFALLGEAMPFSASITKSVTPQGPVDYGAALTYTLVVSAAPGTQLGLYDPLAGTNFVRFAAGGQPSAVVAVDDVVTGTLEVTPTNRVTVSFVARVGVPGTAGWTADVENRACIYPAGGTVEGDCTWSNVVTNEAFHPFGVYLPLVLK